MTCDDYSACAPHRHRQEHDRLDEQEEGEEEAQGWGIESNPEEEREDHHIRDREGEYRCKRCTLHKVKRSPPQEETQEEHAGCEEYHERPGYGVEEHGNGKPEENEGQERGDGKPVGSW